jgi:hypothetical protein
MAFYECEILNGSLPILYVNFFATVMTWWLPMTQFENSPWVPGIRITMVTNLPCDEA